ncbi:hypothetical protein CODIS_14900 [Candidatus Thiodiazotropha endolucinida]|uniref:Uncharacterized protein n=1 Tax=Candidatus Thiodiazotropha endolucinida TaxID=1655433 RepID=A0A7Z1AFV8_9GAMM|nr:hypothetical protein CODIS_14900 [Candidatus Thiodiazotropha endolucinida]
MDVLFSKPVVGLMLMALGCWASIAQEGAVERVPAR